jgi:hypothetical protein
MIEMLKCPDSLKTRAKAYRIPPFAGTATAAGYQNKSEKRGADKEYLELKETHARTPLKKFAQCRETF